VQVETLRKTLFQLREDNRDAMGVLARRNESELELDASSSGGGSGSGGGNSDAAARAGESPWTTSYLHSAHLFQTHAALAPLHARLKEAVLAADAEHWGLLRGRDPARLNFRTVELHEYSLGGSLSDDRGQRHYDCGSLITLDIMLSEVRGEGGRRPVTAPPRWPAPAGRSRAGR
jgi:hypothetical protein